MFGSGGGGRDVTRSRSRWTSSGTVAMRERRLEDRGKRDARDTGMRAGLSRGDLDWTEADEGYLREQWEEFREVFGYDAYEDAETWWVEWGMLMDKADGRAQTPNIFMSEVLVERQEAVH